MYSLVYLSILRLYFILPLFFPQEERNLLHTKVCDILQKISLFIKNIKRNTFSISYTTLASSPWLLNVFNIDFLSKLCDRIVLRGIPRILIISKSISHLGWHLEEGNKRANKSTVFAPLQISPKLWLIVQFIVPLCVLWWGRRQSAPFAIWWPPSC